jgi:predicted metal-dependent hydrolase
MPVTFRIRERLSSAFAVLCGRHGEVTHLAEERAQSRQALYREAERVVEDLEGAKAQSRIAELEQRIAEQQAQLAEQQQRLQRAVEITDDKQAEFASTAQAEGVSLPVARRLLAVFGGKRTPSVATLGRQTAASAQRATELLSVLDAEARPRVVQAAADEIFLAGDRCS